MSLDILIVEDNSDALKILNGILTDKGFNVYGAGNCEEALECVSHNSSNIDLVILDLGIPVRSGEPPDQENGFNVLKAIKEDFAGIYVIILTAFDDVRLAVRGINEGAYDFLTKPLKLELLNDRLKKITELLRLKKEKLRRKRDGAFNNIIGASKGLEKVLMEVEKVADSNLSVLIEGETGTGKELIAEAIHLESHREGELVVVDCSRIPKDLMESELFGHKKGSFTGAIEDHMGKIEFANNGTLFLDEIGELKLELQAKLLRFLEKKEINPVGSNEVKQIDVRVVAASNKNIANMVMDEEFREDLFFRLRDARVVLPPLLERVENIPLLAKFFMDRSCRDAGLDKMELSISAIDKLLSYKWPGNIRELQRMMAKTVIYNRGKEIINGEDISFDDYTKKYKGNNLEGLYSYSLKEAKEVFEKKYLINLLAIYKTQNEAARHAGVEKSNFSKLLRRYELLR